MAQTQLATRTVTSPAGSTDFFLPTTGSIDLSGFKNVSWLVKTDAQTLTVQVQDSLDGTTFSDVQGHSIAVADFVAAKWNHITSDLKLNKARLKVTTGATPPTTIDMACRGERE